MNNSKFDFQEALSYIKSGLSVQLTLNNVTRRYSLGLNNDILCIPNGKEYCMYTMKSFNTDAIMSNDWELCD